MGAVASDYRVEEHTVPADAEGLGEDREITVRCYTPTSRDCGDGGFPLLVWFHGGGELTRELGRRTPLNVVL